MEVINERTSEDDNGKRREDQVAQQDESILIQVCRIEAGIQCQLSTPYQQDTNCERRTCSKA